MTTDNKIWLTPMSTGIPLTFEDAVKHGFLVEKDGVYHAPQTKFDKSKEYVTVTKEEMGINNDN